MNVSSITWRVYYKRKSEYLEIYYNVENFLFNPFYYTSWKKGGKGNGTFPKCLYCWFIIVFYKKGSLISIKKISMQYCFFLASGNSKSLLIFILILFRSHKWNDKKIKIFQSACRYLDFFQSYCQKYLFDSLFTKLHGQNIHRVIM